MSTPRIEFRNVSKSFGSVKASQNLCFSVQPGSIHAIIGENGAGKSTAMKMLFGLEHPDQGEILVDGKLCSLSSPTEAMDLGIGMVHQHFMLAGPFPAIDQLILAQPGGGLSFLSRAKALKHFRALAEKFGFKIDLTQPVEALPVGAQQRLEILKVLARDPKILIFDEPTAVLTPGEVQEFFQQVRELRDRDCTVLIITHKLREVMDLSDEVTIFRQGAVVGHHKTQETSAEKLAELMMGQVDRLPGKTRGQGASPVLTLKDFALKSPEGSLGPLSLEVRSGEIIGIAGVEGNGQDRLIQSLTEARLHSARMSGSGYLLERSLATSKTSELRAAGAAFLPEDRLRYGVLENRPADDNFFLGLQNQAKFRRGPWIQSGPLKSAVLEVFQKYNVQPQNMNLPLGRFSGGNQQKFVVGRELSTHPKFILAAQPTRGVDLGAVRMIHERLISARDRGAGILLISSELEELIHLCDRIHVIYRGQLIDHFSAEEFNEQALGLAMGGRGRKS